MKKFILGMILTFCLISSVDAGEFGFYLGRVPTPPPPPPAYPGYYWYYAPPRAYEFGFYYGDRDKHRKSRYRNDKPDCRPKGCR